MQAPASFGSRLRWWRVHRGQAQLALIATQMVTLEQVFLPYALTVDGRTVYEHVQAEKWLAALPPPAAQEPV